MSAITSKDIEQRLGTISCPLCQKNLFGLRLKSVNSFGENLYSASCMSCGYSFPVSAENELLFRSHPDTVYWLKEIPCPECMMSGADLDFRSTLSVRECRYFVTCRSCRFKFNEMAYMEAFE